MAITLEPGELRELNAQLTPIGVVGPVVVEEMFFATKLRTSGYDSSDVHTYIRIRNMGQQAIVDGKLNVYYWQEWWNQPEGDDQNWQSGTLNLQPGEEYRMRARNRVLMNGDKTYARADVVVNEVVITETPRFYIQPGKSYLGAGARGECIQAGPGFALFWYSTGGNYGGWSTYHRRPPTGEADYVSRFLHFKYTDYRAGDSWQTAFLVVPDDDFIGSRAYLCNIMSGWMGSPEAYFNFTA